MLIQWFAVILFFIPLYFDASGNCKGRISTTFVSDLVHAATARASHTVEVASDGDLTEHFVLQVMGMDGVDVRQASNLMDVAGSRSDLAEAFASHFRGEARYHSLWLLGDYVGGRADSDPLPVAIFFMNPESRITAVFSTALSLAADGRFRFAVTPAFVPPTLDQRRSLDVLIDPRVAPFAVTQTARELTDRQSVFQVELALLMEREARFSVAATGAADLRRFGRALSPAKIAAALLRAAQATDPRQFALWTAENAESDFVLKSGDYCYLFRIDSGEIQLSGVRRLSQLEFSEALTQLFRTLETPRVEAVPATAPVASPPRVYNLAHYESVMVRTGPVRHEDVPEPFRRFFVDAQMIQPEQLREESDRLFAEYIAPRMRAFDPEWYRRMPAFEAAANWDIAQFLPLLQPSLRIQSRSEAGVAQLQARRRMRSVDLFNSVIVRSSNVDAVWNQNYLAWQTCQYLLSLWARNANAEEFAPLQAQLAAVRADQETLNEAVTALTSRSGSGMQRRLGRAFYTRWHNMWQVATSREDSPRALFRKLSEQESFLNEGDFLSQLSGMVYRNFSLGAFFNNDPSDTVSLTGVQRDLLSRIDLPWGIALNLEVDGIRFDQSQWRAIEFKTAFLSDGRGELEQLTRLYGYLTGINRYLAGTPQSPFRFNRIDAVEYVVLDHLDATTRRNFLDVAQRARAADPVHAPEFRLHLLPSSVTPPIRGVYAFAAEYASRLGRVSRSQ